MLKRIALTLTAAVIAVTGLTLSTGTANAETGGRDHRACVTKAEYKSISSGMTRADVASIFDTDGSRLYSNWNLQGTDTWRYYKPCSSFTRHAIVVWFDNYTNGHGQRSYDLYLSQYRYNS